MRPYPLTSHELVDDAVSELDILTASVEGQFGGLGDEQLAWQPSPDRWGIGHCLIHLTRTSELYREALTLAFRDARAAGVLAQSPLRGGWFGRWFTGAVGPDVKMKAKSPRAVRPRHAAAAVGSLERFLTEHHRMKAVMEEGRGLDLDAVRIVSPFSSWLRFRAGDALRIVVEHEKRHVKQACAVLADPSFPR